MKALPLIGLAWLAIGLTACGDGSVVINEIQGHGAVEYLELANAGSSDLDLSGFGVCDEDADGKCQVDAAVRFPEGTVLAPGAYLLVIANQDTTNGPGPYSQCTGGVTSCYYASWKISAVDGEQLRVIDADDVEVASLKYPKDATADDTQSWSRSPDLTGEPEAAAPTPGKANP